MADCLEDVDSVDCDRTIDRCSFNAEKFEVFTHDYRETTEAACQDEEDGDHSKCKHNDAQDKKAKKEMVNITRKIQKAIYTLEALKGSGVINDYLSALKELKEKLRKAIEVDHAEFSSGTVDLPEFDSTDMKLLMGEDEIPEQPSMMDEIRRKTADNKKELDNLLVEAGILLQEYDHIKQSVGK